MRSIARVLTAWRRSTSSPVSRFGSLRATSRSVCVIASGVRSSWEALAANLLLFGDVCFEPREHGVERVGELAELVAAARQLDSVGERPVRGHACGVGDAGQRGEHPAGEKPASDETEHQQERHHDGRLRSEDVQEVGPDGEDTMSVGAGGDEERTVGDVAQEEHPHGGEQQGACEHEEAGVAEGELEANAQPRGSIHALLPHARCLVACRCGSRRRARWR